MLPPKSYLNLHKYLWRDVVDLMAWNRFIFEHYLHSYHSKAMAAVRIIVANNLMASTIDLTYNW